MQLEQRFDLPTTPAQAWPAFHDLELLVNCLPGASMSGPVTQDATGAEGPLRFEVKLGPIAAAFAGNGRLTLDNDALTGKFEGAAVDRKTNSRVKGVASFALTEIPAAQPSEAAGSITRVQVTVDYSLAGSLAQFNRAGIVNELADVMTSQFADRLRAAVSKPQVSAAEASSEAAADTQAAAAAQPPLAAAPVNPLALIWLMVRRRIGRLVSAITGH